MINLDGYLQLAESLFYNNAKAKIAILEALMREYPIYKWFRVRGRINDANRWAVIEKSLIDIGYALWMIHLIGLLGKSPIIVKGIHYSNRLVWMLINRPIGSSQ